MIEFTNRIKAGANFRPSTLMWQYAKANNYKTFDCYGEMRLIINGMTYGYDHYVIENNGDGTETVTVSLKLLEK